jgi:hypothetical protein
LSLWGAASTFFMMKIPIFQVYVGMDRNGYECLNGRAALRLCGRCRRRLAAQCARNFVGAGDQSSSSHRVCFRCVLGLDLALDLVPHLRFALDQPVDDAAFAMRRRHAPRQASRGGGYQGSEVIAKAPPAKRFHFLARHDHATVAASVPPVWFWHFQRPQFSTRARGHISETTGVDKALLPRGSGEASFYDFNAQSRSRAIPNIRRGEVPWPTLGRGVLFLAVFVGNVVLAISAWFVIEWAMKLI